MQVSGAAGGRQMLGNVRTRALWRRLSSDANSGHDVNSCDVRMASTKRVLGRSRKLLHWMVARRVSWGSRFRGGPCDGPLSLSLRSMAVRERMQSKCAPRTNGSHGALLLLVAASARILCCRYEASGLRCAVQRDCFSNRGAAHDARDAASTLLHETSVNASA